MPIIMSLSQVSVVVGCLCTATILAAAPSEERPASLVGLWRSDQSAVLMSLRDTGTLKTYAPNGLVEKDAGHWTHPSSGKLVLKIKGREQESFEYAVRDDQLILTSEDGDLEVWLRRDVANRDSLLGTWHHVVQRIPEADLLKHKDPRAFRLAEARMTFAGDGTFHVHGTNPWLSRPGDGQWQSSDAGAIGLLMAGEQPVVFQAVISGKILSCLMPDGNVVRAVNADEANRIAVCDAAIGNLATYVESLTESYKNAASSEWNTRHESQPSRFQERSKTTKLFCRTLDQRAGELDEIVRSTPKLTPDETAYLEAVLSGKAAELRKTLDTFGIEPQTKPLDTGLSQLADVRKKLIALCDRLSGMRLYAAEPEAASAP